MSSSTVVIFRASNISSGKELCEAFAVKLCFPEYCGRSLDALFDCLTDVGNKLTVVILHGVALESTLGSYAKAFVKMLRAAERANENLKIYYF